MPLSEILITGGAGSLGIRLSLALQQKGRNIRVFDLPHCDYELVEGLENVRILRGDIRDTGTIEEAIAGTQVVIHLAALLPPNSERDRPLTWKINVEGTQRVIDACNRLRTPPHLIFASSVSTYGDTSTEALPLKPSRGQNPSDIYGESKVAAEELILTSGLPATILRISGIAVAAFLDPPEVWPFTAQQRIEFIAANDLVTCLVNAVDNGDAIGKIFNIAGGPSWQVNGEEYVRRFCHTMELPFEESCFSEEPGWLDWYETGESQHLLCYQDTSFDRFHQVLRDAIEEALA